MKKIEFTVDSCVRVSGLRCCISMSNQTAHADPRLRNDASLTLNPEVVLSKEPLGLMPFESRC